jgi:hypothetical protein
MKECRYTKKWTWEILAQNMNAVSEQRGLGCRPFTGNKVKKMHQRLISEKIAQSQTFLLEGTDGLCPLPYEYEYEDQGGEIPCAMRGQDFSDLYSTYDSPATGGRYEPSSIALQMPAPQPLRNPVAGLLYGVASGITTERLGHYTDINNYHGFFEPAFQPRR